MREYKNYLDKYKLKAKSYNIIGKILIINTENGKYVLKKNNNKEIYSYLKTRNFLFYPEIISDNNDDITIYKYIDNINTPRAQKMFDMIDLLSILHNKTAYFKEIEEDEFKRIYEDIKNNIAYLKSYYNDMISVIETRVYWSPTEYLFARNYSKIASALDFCDYELNKWYDSVKNQNKCRVAFLHNNLSLDHFIKNKNSYFISWDKSKIDMPIFDLYKLYKKHGLEFDFETLLKKYEKTFPLLSTERELFFILIALPDIMTFDKSEYENTKDITKKIDIIYKTEKFISPYYLDKKENK